MKVSSSSSSPTRKPWLVQKYGGTSLGKSMGSICDAIVPQHSRRWRLVVVCSALSGTRKQSGTTSLLLECTRLAELGDGEGQRLAGLVDLIRDTHLQLLETFVGARSRSRGYVETVTAIVGECEKLKRFLLAAQVVGDLSARSKDRAISVGEKLACMIMSACLNSSGTPSKVVSLEDVVASTFGPLIDDQVSAIERLGSRFYSLLRDEIASRIRDCGQAVPIVTGFFGIMPDSLLHRVGRGYSDLCAAMCAASVDAVELQIWKEVDGIFTADPRKVPSARLLSTVTPEEAAELTYYGSEVIHPLTMDQIHEAGIPLRLKNVFKPLGHGTIIYPSANPSTPEMLASPADTDSERPSNPSPRSSFMLENGYHGSQQERRKPTAVTTKDDISLINVTCNRNTKSQGFLMQVFGCLERNNVQVDLVTTSERHVSLAIHSPGEGFATLRLKEELQRFGDVAITPKMSIVTLVGQRMRNVVGISSETLTALASEHINIHLVSQGASEINISVVVHAKDAIAAMNAIHRDVLKIPTQKEQEDRFIPGPWLY
ncbi:aspartate kinase [Xylariomycetidae sp. FL0641]|nr:aspartate kinase [Xylariomycetidae sp. FL0641]